QTARRAHYVDTLIPALEALGRYYAKQTTQARASEAPAAPERASEAPAAPEQPPEAPAAQPATATAELGQRLLDMAARLAKYAERG
ncbi:MAG: hypothetical protein LC641_12095, partial [Spirochaeta sp.]|nr:hypothetical protein [Spirochaeta sp.]